MGPDVVYSDDIASYYRPLNRLVYMVEYHLYGLHPFGYHLLSLLIHLGNVLLLFVFGKKIFETTTTAFIAALLFAVHPANAEAINFISARNNLFATFFVLVAAVLFHTGRERHTLKWYLFSALSFLAGLFCKEIALMLLPILFFYPFHSKGTTKPDFKERFVFFIPFIVAALLYFLLRYEALSQIVIQPGTTSNIWSRLTMNLYIIPVYASLLIIPFGYKTYYSIPPDIWQNLKWIIPAWTVLGFIGVFLMRSGSKAAYFALFWLACNYVPISNIIEIPSAAMAERFIYLPSIGVWLLIGFGVNYFISRGASHRSIFTLVAGVTLLLATFSILRCRDWKSDLTLFTSLITIDPESAYGHYNLGGWYREQGNLQKARYHWEKTVQIRPQHTKALNQLGSVSFIENRLSDAERFYRLALDAQSENAEANYNLALILERTGRYGEALVHYKLFLSRVPPEYKNLVPNVTSRIIRLQTM
jgi:hypothetical protein